MLQTYQTLRIFISSPGDVKSERDMAEEVIREVNDSCKEALGISLEVSRWEKLPPETPNLSEQQIQDIINQKVIECNVFILILYKRYGTVVSGHQKSNTEREVETALEMLLTKRQIMFLSYFRDLPENADIGKQERKVKRLRKELSEKGVWFRSYSNPNSFKEMLTHDLYKTVLNYRVSTSKHKALRAFWQLGIIERDTHPRLAIIYPPVDRRYMSQENPDRFWWKRLVPHIVFEDFKALQKIEKGLRLIGFRDFRFYSNASIPPDISDINRVWICIPRNARARQQIELYKKLLKFNFEARTTGREAKLFWRHSATSSKWLEIQSPLSLYLREQRRSQPGGVWNHQLCKIIAEGTLKDYFIAGIRGLGTWGAGWFIDRRYDAFRPYQNSNRDIQMLLEVIYRDERIFDVRDISNEPRSYFEKQNSLSEIKKNIAEYRNS
jgi:hypothetical protein